jgi:hypothetical protein
VEILEIEVVEHSGSTRGNYSQYQCPQSNEHIYCSCLYGTMHRSSITTPMIFHSLLLFVTNNIHHSPLPSNLRVARCNNHNPMTYLKGDHCRHWATPIRQGWSILYMIMPGWHWIWQLLYWMQWSNATIPTSINKCMCKPHRQRVKDNMYMISVDS